MTRLLSVTLVASLCVAQQPTRGSWDAVRALEAGAMVEVVPSAGKRERGRLVRATDNEIVLRSAQTESSFERAQVREVRHRAAVKRWKHAGIGAGVGAGALAGIAAIAMGSASGSDMAKAILLVSAMLGAAAGFGIGALVPGYRTVYKA